MVLGLGWAAVAALAATVITFGRNIFATLQRYLFIIVGKNDFDETLGHAVFNYCSKHMRLVNVRTRSFTGRRAVVKDTGNEELVAFDRLGNQTVIYRRGLRFVRISPGPTYYNPSQGYEQRGISVMIPRFMWNPEKFVRAAISEYNSLRNSTSESGPVRFHVRRLYGKNKQSITIMTGKGDSPAASTSKPGNQECIEAQYGQSLLVKYRLTDLEFDASRHPDPFDFFPFPEDALSVVDEIKTWFRSKKWYQSKNIPWRRGVLVYGPPGTGKTLFLRSIAQVLDIPIFMFDLSSMSNEEFSAAWEEAIRESPAMVLLEDFDAVFHGRTNVLGDKGGGLTFDCLLNSISGVQSANGILLAVTTNHLERIDPALGVPDGESGSSRPGRIDSVVAIGPMDAVCRRRFAEKMLGESYAGLDEMVSSTDGLTAAQFSEKIQRVCLAKFWAAKES